MQSPQEIWMEEIMQNQSTTVNDPAWQQNGHINTKQVTNNIHWISFAIIHLNSVMASSYIHMVTRHKLSISQQTDEKITSITRPSNILIHADIPRADGQVVVGVLMFPCTSWETGRQTDRQRQRERAVTTGQQLLLTLKHYKGNKSSLYRSSCSAKNINPNT